MCQSTCFPFLSLFKLLLMDLCLFFPTLSSAIFFLNFTLCHSQLPSPPISSQFAPLCPFCPIPASSPLHLSHICHELFFLSEQINHHRFHHHSSSSPPSSIHNITRLMNEGGVGTKLEKTLRSFGEMYKVVVENDVQEAIKALKNGNPKFSEDGVGHARTKLLFEPVSLFLHHLWRYFGITIYVRSLSDFSSTAFRRQTADL